MEDNIIKVLAYDGTVSITLANTTKLVEKARKTHDLSPLATATLGRCLTMAALMSSNLKSEEDSITIQIKADGPIGKITVVADKDLGVKGYVSDPFLNLPLKENGKLDVGGAVGHHGMLQVIKDLGMKEPYIGVSPIITGEIAEDFANYYVISEQKNTAIALGVLVDKNGVKNSGGYLVSPMPDVKEETIKKLEETIANMQPISNLLQNGKTLGEIASQIAGDTTIQILDSRLYPQYKCSCSKEKMKKALISLGKEEIEDILEKEKKAHMVCNFCNTEYTFKKEDLEEILQIIENK